MMPEHLTEEQMVGLVLGETVDEAVHGHAAACLTCARQVAEARDGLRLAREVEQEEPGEDFWRRLRDRSVDRVRADDAARRRRARYAWSLAAAATVLLSVLVWYRPGLRPSGERPPSATAWVALPPADQDAGWSIVEEVVPALDDDETLYPDASVLADLSPSESQALLEGLRAELRTGEES